MRNETARRPLELSPEEMRRLGYAAIDRIVEHLQCLREKPATRKLTPQQARQRLGDHLDPEARDATALVDELCRDVFTGIMHLDHPRFFGYVPGPNSFLGIIGELLTCGHNVYGGTWLEASAPTHLEMQVVRHLADACGLPATASGIFLSGGSMANMSALAVARNERYGKHDQRARVYCSAQTHASVGKGLRFLGFSDDQLRRVATDGRERLDVGLLREILSSDVAEGWKPMAVVANAGTTNSGAVDPLRAISEVCSDYGTWMHVDAAYGGAAVLCPARRSALEGVALADSVALDPHKWLFQPYGIGCLLVRDEAPLRRLCEMTASYLSEMEGEDSEVNLFDLGPELTRPSRGLRLWFTLRALGSAALADAIERGFENAEAAQRMLDAHNSWEVVTPAQMGIVTFCFAGTSDKAVCDRITNDVVGKLIEAGVAMVSTTTLRGHPALRMCPINPSTTEDDLRMTIDTLTELALDLLAV